jgi:hypothetical protein
MQLGLPLEAIFDVVDDQGGLSLGLQLCECGGRLGLGRGQRERVGVSHHSSILMRPMVWHVVLLLYARFWIVLKNSHHASSVSQTLAEQWWSACDPHRLSV